MIFSLKKMTIFTIVVILVSATVAWGLKEMTYAETPISKQVEEGVGPIRLTMWLDKLVYELGEGVNVTLMLTNMGNETITLAFVSPLEVDFVILDSSSQGVYSFAGSHGFAGTGKNLTLGPRESFGRTLVWNQETRPTPEDPFHQVESGTYFVFGRIGFGLYFVGPCEHEIQDFKNLQTPKIQIEIKS